MTGCEVGDAFRGVQARFDAVAAAGNYAAICALLASGALIAIQIRLSREGRGRDAVVPMIALVVALITALFAAFTNAQTAGETLCQQVGAHFGAAAGAFAVAAIMLVAALGWLSAEQGLPTTIQRWLHGFLIVVSIGAYLAMFQTLSYVWFFVYGETIKLISIYGLLVAVGGAMGFLLVAVVRYRWFRRSVNATGVPAAAHSAVGWLRWIGVVLLTGWLVVRAMNVLSHSWAEFEDVIWTGLAVIWVCIAAEWVTAKLTTRAERRPSVAQMMYPPRTSDPWRRWKNATVFVVVFALFILAIATIGATAWDPTEQFPEVFMGIIFVLVHVAVLLIGMIAVLTFPWPESFPRQRAPRRRVLRPR